MTLYFNNKGKIKLVKEVPFKLEKDLQTLVENNLSALMNLTLIQSEFVLKDKRFDTLAYDAESKSFVIIEYKRDKNVSVVDQGMTYLNLLLDNKAEGILAAQQVLGKTLNKVNDIDWSQTRVVFVAASFNDFQKQATNFKDLGIELWEVKQFESGHILICPIKRDKNAPSINTLNKTNKESGIHNTIKTYTEEEHVNYGSPEILELYEKFKDALFALDNGINLEPKKTYIAFKKRTNVVDVAIQKKQIKIYLNAKWGMLDDPKHLFENVSMKGATGNGDYHVNISDDRHLEYIMSVIKQVL